MSDQSGYIAGIDDLIEAAIFAFGCAAITICVGGIYITSPSGKKSWYGFSKLLGATFSSTYANIKKSIAKAQLNYEIYQVKQKISTKILTKDGRVDLGKFNNPNGQKQPKGGRSILGPAGYQIVKDIDEHKGSIWKLLDDAGRRIASLAGDGRIVGK